MEGSSRNDAKTSSEEAESPEPATDDAATTGRAYYECVFCKRGFTTAQALGGHMNIHRKDRARMRQPPPPPFRKQEELLHPLFLPASEAMTSYPLYFRRPPAVEDPGPRRLRELSLFGGEEAGAFTGDTSVEEARGKKQQEEDLDLELRLGHHQP